MKSKIDAHLYGVTAQGEWNLLDSTYIGGAYNPIALDCTLPQFQRYVRLVLQELHAELPILDIAIPDQNKH